MTTPPEATMAYAPFVQSLKDRLLQNAPDVNRGANFPGFAGESGGRCWILDGPDYQICFGQSPEHMKMDGPAHRHMDEWMFVMEGEHHVAIDGHTHVIGAGEVLWVPAGVEHKGTLQENSFSFSFFNGHRFRGHR